MLQSNENARDSGLQVYTQGSFEVLNEMKWKAANVYFSGLAWTQLCYIYKHTRSTCGSS